MSLNGQQIAKQNVEKLRAYLEGNVNNLPSFNGRLNKSRIAKDAGLDRQVFESNPAAAELLAKYGDAARLTRLPAVVSDSDAMEKIRRLEAEVSKFRDLAAKRSVELEIRRKCAVETEARLRVFETMLSTMRNVSLPQTEGSM